MLALMGIGHLGQKLYQQLKQHNIEINFLFDNFKSGMLFDTHVIMTPDQIDTMNRSEITVIITTFKQELKKDELNELKDHLISLGFSDILNVQQAIQRYNLNFEYFYIGHFDDEHEGVTQTLDLLSDELSKEIFQSHIDFRRSGDVTLLHRNLSQDDQYVPDFFVQHIYSLDKSLRVIDCGACFGDLLNSALNRSIDVSEYIAFEPDANNREILAAVLCQRNVDSIIMPLGVGEHELNLSFASGEGMGSHFDENGTELIKIVSLDQSVVGRVDWIKMDIEGFEYQALRGAERIIRTNKPALSISLYHKPYDIIDLPLYLRKYYSKFYIRQHGRYGFDLVLYCFN